MRMSELINAAHAKVRAAIRDLPPHSIERLSRNAKYQQIHFYAWLRGKNEYLSLEAIDNLLELSRLHLRLYGNCVHCSAFPIAKKSRKMPRLSPAKKIAVWSLVDWTKSNKEIARTINRHHTLVGVNRRKFAPDTIGHPGKHSRGKSVWENVDYSRPVKEIAKNHNVSLGMVYAMKSKYQSRKDH